ncbi:MAG: S-layer homology domain-containing protein [Agathobaculum sp.]|uniref:S-layer homology domain-containing protein n=1 Tax=Agathobaculum sp. TaxID=2048138 RepID=UPI003D931FED
MKDKKLFICALLLPFTLLFSAAALLAGQNPISPVAGSVPSVQAVEAATCSGVPIEIALTAADAENDIVLFQLTEQPRLGTAVIAGSTLTYSPVKKTGKDKFSYTAVDANGNTAAPAQITVTIEKNKAKLTYADMEGNPAHYAAIRLSAAGLMTGEKIGGCFFFRPAQTITRNEFIAMAATLAALPVEPTEQTDFADDSGLSPWAKPFISTAAANGLVSGYPTDGLSEIRGQNPITLAESCVVLNNLLSNAESSIQPVVSAQHAADMDWAQSAVSQLMHSSVLSSETAHTPSDTPLTRQQACEMLYRTMVLLQQ